MDGDNLIIGNDNSATLATRLRVQNPDGTDALQLETNGGIGASALRAFNGGGGGLDNGETGVLGQCERGLAGVRGDSSRAFGVYGTSDRSVGVNGLSNRGYGTAGRSQTNAGVAGFSADAPGVLGQSGNGVGVRGSSEGRFGVGVMGTTDRGSGLFGHSLFDIGVNGQSSLGTGVRGIGGGGTDEEGVPFPNCVGVYGEAPFGIGIYGVTSDGPNGGVAGKFDGPVIVNGALTVLGAKSAAVRHPDGSHRRLYSVESPESWFEDFGTAKLKRGIAEVKLRPDFAKLVRRDDYHIFLTPLGDSQGLYVSRKSSAGFQIREQQGGTSSLAFSYRIVARRKDIDGRRLEKVNIPRARRVTGNPKLTDKELRVQFTPPELPRLLKKRRTAKRSSSK
jgi:hypothetical protein